VRAAAKDCGYAIAIHGSLARDCDLIAVPWNDSATTPEVLIDTIAQVTNTFSTPSADDSDVKRPHGRRAWKLFFGGKPYFDVSVMPKHDVQLSALVRELLDLLEVVEESDGGKEFHPTTIQTCRVLVAERLATLMPAIRKLVTY